MKKFENNLIFIIAIYAGLILFAVIFIKGMPYKVTDYSNQLLPEDTVSAMDTASAAVTDLLIYEEDNKESVLLLDQYREILKEMKAGVEEENLGDVDFDALKSYSRVLLDLPNLSAADDYIEQLEDYVAGGGQLLVWRPPNFSLSSRADWKGLLGIENVKGSSTGTESFYPSGAFMLGGERKYTVRSTGKSAANVSLDESCSVSAWDKVRDIPLVWERSVGNGRVVVCNYPDLVKETRGIYSSSYSLLGQACVWPVINSQTFFLDDFPAPLSADISVENISGGKTLYQSFIADQWWPDLHELSRKYDLPYTAGLIETYDLPADGQIKRTTDLTGFTNYGRAVTYEGGEIGVHGYNHQPLVGEDYQYKGDVDYQPWASFSLMYQSLAEAVEFTKAAYPGCSPSVYIPPSNILSQEGRQMIGNLFPEIHSIASAYTEGADAYSQEFQVAEDGVIETPRITSGEIIDEKSMLLACSELNFHYVNTHFIHPDDITDEERTGGQKWIFLRDRLDQYLGYIQDSAPNMRKLTGTGLAGAVERYYYVRPETEAGDSEITIRLANHTDTEYMMVRINNGKKSDGVTGGSIEQLTDCLYLVTCDRDQVTINLK